MTDKMFSPKFDDKNLTRMVELQTVRHLTWVNENLTEEQKASGDEFIKSEIVELEPMLGDFNIRVSVYLDCYCVCIKDTNRNGETYFSEVATVYKRSRFSSMKSEPAQINWSACGSVSVEFTKKFMKAMEIALSLASQIDEFAKEL